MTDGVASSGYVAPTWPAWLWRGGRVELHVDQPPPAFLAALSTQTGPRFLRLPSSKRFTGRVTADGCVLITKNSRLVRNSWESWLDATVEPDGGGSVIRGEFRLSRFALVFTLLGVSFINVGMVGAIGGEMVHGLPPGAIIGLVLDGLFFVLLSFARLIALGQERDTIKDLATLGSPPFHRG